MSEQFRSIRHITAHVKEQRRVYTELDEAIGTVSGLLDSLPEKKREVEALAEQATAWQTKIGQLEEGHKLLMDQCRNQRAETQELMKREQQERVGAREAFRIEQQQWQGTMAKLREEVNECQRAITQKKGELERLEQDLQATVKAVLRR